jgi:hypothetical protein
VCCPRAGYQCAGSLIFLTPGQQLSLQFLIHAVIPRCRARWRKAGRKIIPVDRAERGMRVLESYAMVYKSGPRKHQARGQKSEEGEGDVYGSREVDVVNGG